MENIQIVVDRLESVEHYYGIGGVILIVLLIIIGILIWRFALKLTEKTAEEISDKSVKQFQSLLDKELVKFSTRHQKQIDAVQDCFQQFQQLQSFVNYIIKGERFTAPISPEEELNYLAKYRLEFKRSYARNRILFPERLNQKIETLFPELDKFIEDYMSGLLPTTPITNIPEEFRSESQLAGIWPLGKLEPTLMKMEEISKGIEAEFRKLYGTDDK